MRNESRHKKKKKEQATFSVFFLFLSMKPEMFVISLTTQTVDRLEETRPDRRTPETGGVAIGGCFGDLQRRGWCRRGG